MSRTCLLNPGTPLGFTELWIRSRIDRARAHAAAGDRGASVVEWVIISALAVGIAVAVGAILLAKLQDKANSIDLDTSTGGGGGGGGNQGPP